MRHLILLMTLLGIFLSRGCGSFSTSLHGGHVEKFEQCAPTFVYTDDSKKFIDAEKSYCSTRSYGFSLEHVGPVAGTSSKKHISYCDRCVGFKNYTDLINFFEESRKELRQHHQEEVAK